MGEISKTRGDMMSSKKKPSNGGKVETRGHKKGVPRPDHQPQLDPGDNTKFITHNLQVNALADVKCDTRSAEAVSKRITEYFTLCAQNDMKPSVAGLALAFGISRKTLYDWVANQRNTLTPESRQPLLRAYQMLNAQMEDYMQNGKINPVAGIFLMKNNMGYEDKKEVTVGPSDNLRAEMSPDELRRKYLSAIETDEKRMIAESAERAEDAERLPIAEGAESAESAERDLLAFDPPDPLYAGATDENGGLA